MTLISMISFEPGVLTFAVAVAPTPAFGPESSQSTIM